MLGLFGRSPYNKGFSISVFALGCPNLWNPACNEGLAAGSSKPQQRRLGERKEETMRARHEQRDPIIKLRITTVHLHM